MADSSHFYFALASFVGAWWTRTSVIFNVYGPDDLVRNSPNTIFHTGQQAMYRIMILTSDVNQRPENDHVLRTSIGAFERIKKRINSYAKIWQIYACMFMHLTKLIICKTETIVSDNRFIACLDHIEMPTSSTGMINR